MPNKSFSFTKQVFGLLILALMPCAAMAQDSRKPNLIVILTDDQGYADVGFNGCKDIPTPHIDRIATQGVRCTNGYVTYAVCGPSRAGLITGRYQDRFGACRNPTIDPSVPNNGVPLSEKNIAELLKPAGYRSMAIGKWHLGSHPDLQPRDRGFDEFYGFLSGGHDYFPDSLTLQDLSEVRKLWDWYRTKLLHNGERIQTDEYLTDELSHMAVDFIERSKDQPFFLYLAYNAPHTPLQASQKYLARFPGIQNEQRRTYAAMVSAVDDGVGRVLDKLAEHDLEESTLVFFLSDNGGATNNASRNTPLRGYKSSPYEGGVRVPFAVRWTGTLPAGQDYDLPVSSLDIAATIVVHAGVEVSAEKPLDGVDLVPYLTGKTDSAPHEKLFWKFYDRGVYITRSGNDKLILQRGQADEFYRLNQDLAEENNLAPQAAEGVVRLRNMIDSWDQQTVPPLAPGLGSWDLKRD